MILQYLKFVKKWVIKYHGQAVAVGNTQSQAIDEAMELLRLKVIK